MKAELQDAYETLLGERRRLAPFKGIADVNLRDYVILVQIQSEELRRENTALKQRVKRLNEPNHEHWMERTEGTLPATLA